MERTERQRHSLASGWRWLHTRLVHGIMQPLVALKLVLRDPLLRHAAVIPAIYLVLICGGWALLRGGDTAKEMLRDFYTSFVALAPVPSIVLGRHYAQLAALAHERLGFGPHRPFDPPLVQSLRRAVSQVVVVAIGILPFLALIKLVPGVGHAIAFAAGWLWSLHWIVVDALDGARALAPDETLDDIERMRQALPAPWFVRWPQTLGPHLPGRIRRLSERFTRFSDRLSRHWREEFALIEAHPATLAGFGVGTNLLLALPVLNLLFRPVVLVAAVGLIQQLEGTSRTAPARSS